MTSASVDTTYGTSPYPEYKDSGEDWLGKIPASWELKRLRFVLSVRPSPSELNGLSPDTPVSFLPMELIGDDGTFDREHAKAISDIGAGFTYFAEGDVTVAKITPCFENGKGALMTGLVNGVGFGTTELHVLRPGPKLDGHFLYYLTISHPFRTIAAAHMYGTGGQKRVPEEFIRDLRVGIPSLVEQRRIVAFLDSETAKIDAMITRKERLIELLEERRTALISQVVTKGLTSDIPMKYSGVEWLGDIPSHWKALQLKRVARIDYGLVLELDRTETEGIPIISLPNVTKDGQLLLEDVPRTKLIEKDKKHLLLKKGDLLFNWRNGSPDHIGKTAYFNADGEYTHVSFLLRLRFDQSKHNPRYYQMFLNNLRNTGFFSSSKSMVNKTYNQTELGRLEVVVPPIEQQNAIAQYLEHKTANIDKIIVKTRWTIHQLREYRIALITMAVTGKIDVRSFQHRNGQESLHA
jgi:type I restriction enzyme, S subunit